MATIKKTLNNSTYTEVTTGQCFCTIPDGMTVLVNIGSSLPAANTDLHHTATKELNYAGSETVYMMIGRNTASISDIVVTEVV